MNILQKTTATFGIAAMGAAAAAPAANANGFWDAYAGSLAAQATGPIIGQVLQGLTQPAPQPYYNAPDYSLQPQLAPVQNGLTPNYGRHSRGQSGVVVVTPQPDVRSQLPHCYPGIQVQCWKYKNER